MDATTWTVLVLVLSPAFIGAWHSSREYRRDPRELRRVHYHSKRHMLASETDTRKKSTTMRPREIRKKPSGHLAPLDEDDMDNDEVVSVAIGPPPIRPKYDKVHKKNTPKLTTSIPNITAANLVKDVIIQLSREFLTRQVNEDFVFGQYVGNSMRNLSSELRLSMQHEILELVVKYQKLNRGGMTKSEEKNTLQILKDVKIEKKFVGSNDTEESWPDFSNLEKIVG